MLYLENINKSFPNNGSRHSQTDKNFPKQPKL
jgi:hypothetical protein